MNSISENKSIFQLELHESTWINGMLIIRVSGGWIYNVGSDQHDGFTPIFVPFNNELEPGHIFKPGDRVVILESGVPAEVFITNGRFLKLKLYDGQIISAQTHEIKINT